MRGHLLSCLRDCMTPRLLCFAHSFNPPGCAKNILALSRPPKTARELERYARKWLRVSIAEEPQPWPMANAALDLRSRILPEQHQAPVGWWIAVRAGERDRDAMLRAEFEAGLGCVIN